MRQKICLETSSYLPLIWCTPYTQGLINAIQSYHNEADFYIQKDCILEAMSYINYPKNWFRHAPIRLRQIAKVTSDKIMDKMSFPSSAFQIVLGGKMWAQGLYLNFIRHTTFLYSDLIDKIDFTHKRQGLICLADAIEERYLNIKNIMEYHLHSSFFDIDLNNIFPYWGLYYLYDNNLTKIKINVWDSNDKFEKGIAKIRDVFHYESMVNSPIKFNKMIVANTGFYQHIKKEFKIMDIEIVSVYSRQTEIFE